jgi:hypothetical protein
VTAISHDVPAAEPALTGLTVKDVMVTAPATMRPTATVADARAFFEDDHVHMALITTRGRLLGRSSAPTSPTSTTTPCPPSAGPASTGDRSRSTNRSRTSGCG